MGGGAGRGGRWWGLTLSLPQGSLLKVVLEDYLRLKKLFAQRMVQKATSCHSSISEVAGGLGAVCCAPALGVLSPPCLSSSESLKCNWDPRPQWGGGGSRESRQLDSALWTLVDFPRDGWVLRQCFSQI